MNIEHRTQHVEPAFAKASADKHRISKDESRVTSDGFSLTEVLMSIGILAIGMLFIAGVFPVSIHFTTVATERTIAAAVADEAFAKIKLYGINLGDPDLNSIAQRPFEFIMPLVPFGEYGYPSTPTNDPALKRYWWSAICRKVGDSDIQVTVFVSRKTGAATTYESPAGPSMRPVAMPVEVAGAANSDELTITNISKKTFINDGYSIVGEATGQIYRVLERYSSPPGNDSVIRLDQPWQGGALPDTVWVVPPPRGGGRNPCIAIYQKVMRF